MGGRASGGPEKIGGTNERTDTLDRGKEVCGCAACGSRTTSARKAVLERPHDDGGRVQAPGVIQCPHLLAGAPLKGVPQCCEREAAREGARPGVAARPSPHALPTVATSTAARYDRYSQRRCSPFPHPPHPGVGCLSAAALHSATAPCGSGRGKSVSRARWRRRRRRRRWGARLCPLERYRTPGACKNAGWPRHASEREVAHSSPAPRCGRRAAPPTPPPRAATAASRRAGPFTGVQESSPGWSGLAAGARIAPVAVRRCLARRKQRPIGTSRPPSISMGAAYGAVGSAVPPVFKKPNAATGGLKRIRDHRWTRQTNRPPNRTVCLATGKQTRICWSICSGNRARTE